ncbi:M23 family metallopeptidase [Brevibacillus fulvus]|uniref:M23ase beta-sheet core domain-containing protein n=1 Tax=Brevibacillus fulvus TaxID=1125967 RepID=A0A938Y2H7_9BACL|nr:M23 family metallopeptidase [Brevibacillus fulvus]MBM7591194.1 hypothetical protein [Brevibacillus fulvus]
MSVFDAYRITSPYGPRTSPITGKPEKHTGIDLVKKIGGPNAPIEAFVAGKVTWAKEVPAGVSGTGFGGFGLVVGILDKYGALHMYAHLHDALVKLGEQVKAGQVIGHQGRTGKSTGEHLHYEVRRKGTAPCGGYGSDTEPTEYLVDYFNKEPKQAPAMTLEASLQKLASLGVMKSPDYWRNVAAGQEEANPAYLATLYKNMAKALGRPTDCLETALAVMQAKGVINSPQYWANAANSQKKPEPKYVAQLLINLATKL